MKVDLNLIEVRPERQRKDLGDLEDLKSSIRNLGLINPIVVEEKEDGQGYWVIAGERRFRALQGIAIEDGTMNSQAEIRLFSDLDEEARQLIELDENIKRKNLEWPEYVRALDKMWKLLGAGKMSQAECAERIGVPQKTFNHALAIFEYLDDERVQAAVNFSNAYNIVQRINDRKMANVMMETLDTIDSILEDEDGLVEKSGETGDSLLGASSKKNGGAEKSHPSNDGIAKGGTDGQLDLEDFLDRNSSGRSADVAPANDCPYKIIQGDFFEWAAGYEGKPFDFIHCDFPYGIEHDRSEQGRTDTFGAYEDSEDIYKKLVLGLLAQKDKIIAPSANVVCWLSLRYAEWTRAQFEAAGFQCLVQPFIWHKNDGKGIVADPACGMRNVGEYALVFVRNRRRVAKIIANIIDAPATKHFHASEKPREVLDKLFSAFVDDSSRVLDPTCGSGTSIQAAWKNKAKEALGIELDGGFAIEAQKWLEQEMKAQAAVDNLEIDL